MPATAYIEREPRLADSEAWQKSFAENADVIIAPILGVAAFVQIWICLHLVDYGLRGMGTENVWFESDVRRVFATCIGQTMHYRVKIHPLFALIAMPLCKTLIRSSHLSTDSAVDVFMAATAGTWSVLFYLVSRKLGFDHVFAALGTILGLSSSAFLFFQSIPETYGLASVSILAAVLLKASAGNGEWPVRNAVLASGVSLSITVTNWMLGLLFSFRHYRPGKALRVSLATACVAGLLVIVQYAVMPRTEARGSTTSHRVAAAAAAHTGSGAFYGPASSAILEELSYTAWPSWSRLSKVARSFVFHSVVAPAAEETPDFGRKDEMVGPVWPKGFSFQNSRTGSSSPWGAIAVLIWGGCLLSGLVAMMRSNETIPGTLLIFLGFQFCLHSVYGTETFMYALDWVPILLLVALYGLQRLGRIGWIVLALLILSVAINNAHEFRSVTTVLHSYAQTHAIPRS